MQTLAAAPEFLGHPLCSPDWIMFLWPDLAVPEEGHTRESVLTDHYWEKVGCKLTFHTVADIDYPDVVEFVKAAVRNHVPDHVQVDCVNEHTLRFSLFGTTMIEILLAEVDKEGCNPAATPHPEVAGVKLGNND